MTVLRTDRLTMRPPQARDEADFIRFYMSDRACYVGGPLNEHRASLMFHSHVGLWATRGYGLWATCLHGEDDPLGFVGCFHPTGWPEQELGWLVYDSAEGQGIAFEAASAARDHVFAELRWPTAVSYIAPENDRSIALAKRLGATLDDTAQRPVGSACLVFRHPRPEEGE